MAIRLGTTTVMTSSRTAIGTVGAGSHMPVQPMARNHAGTTTFHIMPERRTPFAQALFRIAHAGGHIHGKARSAGQDQLTSIGRNGDWDWNLTRCSLVREGGVAG